MRSKDRLDELRRLAESRGSWSGTYHEAADAPQAQHPAHIDALLREVERTRAWIHELDGNTQLLRRLHSDPTFHNNKQLQDQLDAVVLASNAVGLKVCSALRQLEGAAGGGSGAAGARIARLQYAATRLLYGEALRRHHAALAALHDSQLSLLHQQMKLTNLSVSDEECESLLESKNLSLFVGNVGAETAEAQRQLRAVEARRDELARVEGALRDVRDLFLQLAVLVASQQDRLDSVEYYALQATEHVEAGGHQLLKGTVSRTRTRKKKLHLLICIFVGLLVVVIVLVVT